MLFGNALTLGTYDGGPSGWGADSQGRYPALKIPVEVDRGVIATVSVLPQHEETISLIYMPEAFRGLGRYQVNEGVPEVVFEACDNGTTLFNGGLIVTMPGCYHLRVQWDDGVEEATLLIGVDSCP